MGGMLCCSGSEDLNNPQQKPTVEAGAANTDAAGKPGDAAPGQAAADKPTGDAAAANNAGGAAKPGE